MLFLIKSVITGMTGTVFVLQCQSSKSARIDFSAGHFPHYIVSLSLLHRFLQKVGSKIVFICFRHDDSVNML